MGASPIPDAEEVIVPFREPKAQLPLATHFRSTWLSASLRSLRIRDLFDRYLALLPAEHHHAVLGAVAGTWLPIEVALAHYEALDALGLGVALIVEIGREASQRTQGSVMSVAIRGARSAQDTPWAVLAHMTRAWERTWTGGGCAVFKIGPREARIEVARWPCARVPYCRIGLRGVIQGWVETALPKVLVTELAALCSPQSLGFRVQWS